MDEKQIISRKDISVDLDGDSQKVYYSFNQELNMSNS